MDQISIAVSTTLIDQIIIPSGSTLDCLQLLSTLGAVLDLTFWLINSKEQSVSPLHIKVILCWNIQCNKKLFRKQIMSKRSCSSFRGRQLSTQKERWGHKHWTHIDISYLKLKCFIQYKDSKLLLLLLSTFCVNSKHQYGLVRISKLSYTTLYFKDFKTRLTEFNS